MLEFIRNKKQIFDHQVIQNLKLLRNSQRRWGMVIRNLFLLLALVFSISCSPFVKKNIYPVIAQTYSLSCKNVSFSFGFSENSAHFNLWGGIDDCVSIAFKEWSDEVMKRGVKRVVIYVSSEGGEYYAAKAIIGMMDVMKAGGIEIETRIVGKAMSGGGMIAINGQKRCIYPNASMMFHLPGISGAGEMDKETKKRLEKLAEEVKNYIMSKLNISESELNDILGKELLQEEIVKQLGIPLCSPAPED